MEKIIDESILGETLSLEKNKKNSETSHLIHYGHINAYIEYKKVVRSISNLSIKKFKLKNCNKRSKMFHLDHKISICYGFNNYIPAYVIGSIYNLEILTCNENCSKQEHNSIDPVLLYDLVKNNSFYDKVKERYKKHELKINKKRII
jgi:hypothetical protein